jgi:hypothetical protein
MLLSRNSLIPCSAHGESAPEHKRKFEQSKTLFDFLNLTGMTIDKSSNTAQTQHFPAGNGNKSDYLTRSPPLPAKQETSPNLRFISSAHQTTSRAIVEPAPSTTPAQR